MAACMGGIVRIATVSVLVCRLFAFQTVLFPYVLCDALRLFVLIVLHSSHLTHSVRFLKMAHMAKCLQVVQIVKRSVVCDFADVIDFVARLPAHDASVVVTSQRLSSYAIPQGLIDSLCVLGLPNPCVLMFVASSAIRCLVRAAWFGASPLRSCWHGLYDLYAKVGESLHVLVLVDSHACALP